MIKLPKVSVIIPTLNAASVLENCLESISKQDYPKKNVEIIIADGGSTDETLKIAKKYGAKIVKNKLKTGESGKAIGVKKSTGNFIALIDSDNILPDKNWLKQMIAPLIHHRTAVGSEPLSYIWRKSDGFITRYCALIGMNDPLVHFLGNYDRINLLTGKWTEVSHKEKEHKDYIVAEFNSKALPTIGANGTVFRAEYLRAELQGDYLFDIDIIARTVHEKGSVRFIKVKNGIIHTYCERDILKFARKQRRRVKDFMFHKWHTKNRSYDWYEKDIFGNDPWGIIRFVVYCVTIVPLFLQAIKGYIKKPDIAWFFHPLACEITLWEYGWGRIIGVFRKGEQNRENWGQ